MLGTVIGNYQLLRKLGEGGMGAVYLGHHALLGRRAAIKVLLPSLSAREDVVGRFFNEARAVTSISDPGIVQVFDFGYHTDGSAFIVMELLEGEPLDHRLARLGRLASVDALRLTRQVASSLAAAHTRGIIHRDLKPENIFLVRDAEVSSGERPKILDFGIAKLADDHPDRARTHAGMLIGTPMYMSPEQCRGLAALDHRSDIYSLGCVLFHLLTGAPPFDAESTGEIIAAHLREPAPPPSTREPGISPAVDAIVLRCLAKSADERYRSMAELATAIEQLLPYLTSPGAVTHYAPGVAGGPTPMRTPTPPSTTLGASAGQVRSQLGAAPRRSRRALLAGTLGALAAAATIAIVLASQANAPRDTPRAAASPAAVDPPRANASPHANDSPPAAIDSPRAQDPPPATNDSPHAAIDSSYATIDSPRANDSPPATNDSPRAAIDSPRAQEPPPTAIDSPHAHDSPRVVIDPPRAAIGSSHTSSGAATTRDTSRVGGSTAAPHDTSRANESAVANDKAHVGESRAGESAAANDKAHVGGSHAGGRPRDTAPATAKPAPAATADCDRSIDTDCDGIPDVR